MTMTKRQMTHYVLIDNHSGYVWGEADAADPVDACRAVDAEIGGEPREYELISSGAHNTTVSGYHVYAAPSGWREIQDGQSQEEIERVQSECRRVCFVRSRVQSDEDA